MAALSTFVSVPICIFTILHCLQYFEIFIRRERVQSNWEVYIEKVGFLIGDKAKSFRVGVSKNVHIANYTHRIEFSNFLQTIYVSANGIREIRLNTFVDKEFYFFFNCQHASNNLPHMPTKTIIYVCYLGGSFPIIGEIKSGFGTQYSLNTLSINLNFNPIRFLDANGCNGQIRAQLQLCGAFRNFCQIDRRLGVGFSDLKRCNGIFGGIFGDQNRFASVVEREQKPNDTCTAKPQLPVRPRSSFRSRVRSLPLSAKIILTAIPIWPAWFWFFRALDYLDGYRPRVRNRWKSLLFVLLSFGGFALSAATWWFSGP